MTRTEIRMLGAAAAAGIWGFGCGEPTPDERPSDGAGGSGGALTSVGGAGPETGGALSENSGGKTGTGGDPSGETHVPRPQLTEDEAGEHTVLNYLKTRGSVVSPTVDDWDPTAGLGEVASFTPTYTVAETGGTHTSVQAAITDALGSGGTDRIYIAVEPGTYRELVCVNSSNPPITLYGTGADPSQAIIVFDNSNGKVKAEDEPGNPCSPALGSTTYGTSGSSTMIVAANQFQAKNLTIENDTDEATASGGLQAVALMTSGDQIILEQVRLLGNQDTFYVKGVSPALSVRVYVADSYIAGDTDFIFGYARLVIENSTLHVVGDRKDDTVIVAPSTHAQNPFGFLIQGSTISADENVTVVRLGRAWDEGQGDLVSYIANAEGGDYPNGTAVVRDSVLDAPIADAAWASAATTGRPFSSIDTEAPKNRLFEYNNTGPGSVDRF